MTISGFTHVIFTSRFKMLAEQFYDIIHNEESTTNFLIAKNLLVHFENIYCDKCGSEMNYS